MNTLLSPLTAILPFLLLGLTISEAEARKLTEIPYKTMEGKTSRLSDYPGRVILLVNVASKCGLTPQYKQLEEIYQRFKDRGFVVLGFPANNFAGQEPGTDAEILAFCELNYGVTFPVMSKVSVKGKNIHPLYAFLTGKKTNPAFGGEITWNFNKFLIAPDGRIAGRFGKEKPDHPGIIALIESLLPAEPDEETKN